jgi:hypothetical protein
MIRPILEYACVVWNPYLINQISKIESVQRYVTKRINGYSFMSYTERLTALRLPTLSSRREYFDLLEIYKIIRGLTFTSFPVTFTNHSSRGHSFRLRESKFKRNIRKSALFTRAVRQWNLLPSHIVGSITLSSFKLKLQQHLNV